MPFLHTCWISLLRSRFHPCISRGRVLFSNFDQPNPGSSVLTAKKSWAKKNLVKRQRSTSRLYTIILRSTVITYPQSTLIGQRLALCTSTRLNQLTNNAKILIPDPPTKSLKGVSHSRKCSAAHAMTCQKSCKYSWRKRAYNWNSSKPWEQRQTIFKRHIRILRW